MNTASSQMLLIRADASVRMGTGHIMRCLALAQVWRESGGKAVFLGLIESQGILDRLEAEGFTFLPVPNAYPNPLDIKTTIEAMEREGAEWLALDGYHFTAEYQRAVRNTGCKLLVVDDNAHLPEYHADVLLNQNIFGPVAPYACNPDARMLLGTDYVLLRDEFFAWEHKEVALPERASRLLVTIGGSDPKNVTGLVLKALRLLDDPDIEVEIIAGPAYAFHESLQRHAAMAPFSVQIMKAVNNMPERIARADLVVAAAGITGWELAYLGTPGLLFAWADNQRDIGRLLHERGVAEYVGWSDDATPSSVADRIEELLGDRSTRIAMATQGRELVDGRGRDRVLQVLWPEKRQEQTEPGGVQP